MSIFELFARQVFSVVDVKHVDQFWIEGFDHLHSRTAGVKVKTVDHETEVRAIRRVDDLVSEVERGHAAIDRKSTRLNSSHSQISYAVFCLKKKKRQKQSM